MSQPELSEEQSRQSASWQNPAADGGTICTSADSLFPEDVSQHTVSDCSFCASIAVCIAHNRTFKTKVGLLRACWGQRAQTLISSSGFLLCIPKMTSDYQLRQRTELMPSECCSTEPSGESVRRVWNFLRRAVITFACRHRLQSTLSPRWFSNVHLYRRETRNLASSP